MDATELLFQAFRAAGADDGVVYLSLPITSGRRELSLLRSLGCTREELRRDHCESWLAEVVRANELDAGVHSRRLRELLPHKLVVNPANLNVPDWSQEDYGRFWDELVKRYATRVVIAPGWEFSRGARAEVALAIRLNLPILNLDGVAATSVGLQAADGEARRWMAASGFSDAEIADYLPPLSVPQMATSFGTDDALMFDNRAASETFGWLRGERGYQLAKFGLETDDKHTRGGLGQESWWWQQFMNYYGRAQVLGLDNPVGRQALAKFVATACGLLESVVRIYGPLPSPGVPSGGNMDTVENEPSGEQRNA